MGERVKAGTDRARTRTPAFVGGLIPRSSRCHAVNYGRPPL